MTRVIVLGANGMLGRTVFLELLANRDIQVAFANRPESTDESLRCLISDQLQYDFDANFPESHRVFFDQFRPEWVINCIGVVKQRREANDLMTSLRINSVLPHWLASECASGGARLIHISTDCVFSGEIGNYCESDKPDATDLYGKSKALGEVSDKANCLTIRTSIVGHELYSRLGLLDWFLGEQSLVEGYTNAYFSGLTTLELSNIIIREVYSKAPQSGLFQIAGPKISKFDLLNTIKEVYDHNVRVIPSSKVIIDRSLDSSLWTSTTGYRSKSWVEMLSDLKAWKDRRFWVKSF